MDVRVYLRELVSSDDTEAVYRFIDDNIGIFSKDFLWINKVLTKSRKYKFDFQAYLWDAVLKKNRSDPTILDALLQCAQESRNLAWEGTLADLLEKIPKGEDQGLAHRWCMIGETRLQQGELRRAADCFAKAEHVNRGYARALAGRMSVELDRGQRAAARRIAVSLARALKRQPDISDFVDRSSGFWIRDRTATRTLEVVVFCHVTKKIVYDADHAPPSIGLVQTAISTMRAKLSLTSETKFTVYFDSRETPTDDKLQRNLHTWCDPQGMTVVVNVRNGLRRQWLDAFSRATADVVAVVEQDHEFLDTCPSASELLAVLQRRPDVQYIRLGRGQNAASGTDRLLFATPRDLADSICRTARFSNTPHFQRREFYRDAVKPVIAGNTSEDHENDGAGGVEGNMNAFLQKVERRLGAPATARLLGNALWGAIGGEGMVKHTASRKFVEA